MGEEDEGVNLEFTPTWIVAGICSVIVAISLGVERLLHFTGTYFKRKNQKPLFEALQKVKEELMLMGFISLLLTVSQNWVVRFCVKEDLLTTMLPCPQSLEKEGGREPSHHAEHSKMATFSTVGGLARRLLSEAASAAAESESGSKTGYCARKGKVPMLSLEAIHHLHIFIFVLAIVHVTFCALTVMFGGARIRQWHEWETKIEKDHYDAEQALQKRFTHVRDHSFIRDYFSGIGKDSEALGWVHAFLKQFYAAVTRTDYLTLRLGFIMTHCRGNPKFNFHRYMMRALEDDFKRVVGISWYLWIFVVFFLLLNVNGWHAYFWIAFIPFILLLALGTKLEHVIAQLAHEVAEKHIAIEGALVVQPSDHHFWFSKPRAVLYLIHFILFQNSFEIAFFFWIWIQYGFNSCIMGQVRYIVPRVLIGIFIQVLCSYSTLPLYALVTQMGTTFKKAIFEEHIQASLVDWAARVKRKKEQQAMAASDDEGGIDAPPRHTSKLSKLKGLISTHDVPTSKEAATTPPPHGHDRPGNNAAAAAAGETSDAADAAAAFEEIQLSPADGKHK